MPQKIRTNPQDFTEIRRILTEIVRRLPKQSKLPANALPDNATLAEVIVVVNQLIEAVKL